MDVSTGARRPAAPDVTAAEVAAAHPGGADAVCTGDRGRAVTAMGEALGGSCRARGDVGGVLGLGGSGGTALIAPAMRALPVGVPKVMVSTVASGNTAPYVGAADITMMYSVVDVAGLNRVSRQVLANAAHALAGMVAHRDPAGADRPAVGMTMFGVTTPCVTAVRAARRRRRVPRLPRHRHRRAGDGEAGRRRPDRRGPRHHHDRGRDEVVGGVLPPAEDRLDAIPAPAVPYVGSSAPWTW